MKKKKAREDAILDLLIELTWILSTIEGLPLVSLLAKMRALKAKRS